VRIGTTYNRTFYFVDKGVQRGVAYDYGRSSRRRARLNKYFKTDNDSKVNVFFVPLPRDIAASGDCRGQGRSGCAAQVTVRPELLEVRLISLIPRG